MNKLELNKTKWIQDLKNNNLVSKQTIKTVLDYASNPKIIFNIQRDKESGLYAIHYNNFWLNAFTKKQYSINFCKQFNLKFKLDK